MQTVTKVNLEVASLTLRMPTSYLYREGCHAGVLAMEAASAIRRGSRDGMCRKLSCPVLEIHGMAGRLSSALYKETKSACVAMEVGGAHSTD